jgi:putative ABC transport system ATP-binding protein
MSQIVQLREIEKSYRLGRIDVLAVREVTLDIGRGDFVALAGPSGSGKTTLLNIVGCIDKPRSGNVIIDGVDVTSVPLHRLAGMRRDTLGYIFQTFNLVPVLTAYENVEYPLIIKGVAAKERDRRVRSWLDRVGLSAQLKQRPDQLSGGQRQRVAIARAMVGEPRLVLADEPTANLDSETATKILDLLAEINTSTQCTFVFATHDPALMGRARRVIRLRDGCVAQDSEAEALAS